MNDKPEPLTEDILVASLARALTRTIGYFQLLDDYNECLCRPTRP